MLQSEASSSRMGSRHQRLPSVSLMADMSNPGRLLLLLLLLLLRTWTSSALVR